MATLLERSDQALPITEMARSAKKFIDAFQKGEKSKYVVMRNNIPAAVMMSVSHYEEMMDLIEDLRLELIAGQRLKTMEPDTLISHEEMVTDFAEDTS